MVNRKTSAYAHNIRFQTATRSQKGGYVQLEHANPPYGPSTYELPVLLVHGLNGRDDTISESKKWGRIPARLRAAGYSVWFGNQDSWTGVAHNARQIAATIREVIQLAGAPKLHIIAHSKGGVDARAALYEPGVVDRVFSLTTLATPHQGTRFSSVLNAIPLVVPYVVVPIFNLYARLTGDPQPDSRQVLKDMTLKRAHEFAEQFPVPEGVEYHSFAFIDERPRFRMPHPASLVMSAFDGRTDGVVPLRSTEQPNRVLVRVVGKHKITHDEPNDLHRRDICFVLPDGTEYDSAPSFLIGILGGLTADYRASVAYVSVASASPPHSL